MNKIFSILCFFTIVLGMLACKKEEPEPKNCPSTTDNLNVLECTLGEWKLNHEGNDGFSEDGRDVRASCGWTYNGGETGGVGNTYALKNADGSIILRWKGRWLAEFEVHPGWTGSTEAGIQMGDSINKVLTAYERIHAMQSSPYKYVREGNPELRVDFDQHWRVQKILVTMWP
ncbi:MAG: hypothetical protein WCG98_00190 [bacterium]